MNFENISILIGDDSILARKQLKDILLSFGATNFLEATNGEEVIDLYKKNTPDLVFLDIVMPVKDGINAVREITNFNPDADIVMVSSVGTQEELKAAINAGAHDFIQKPLDKEQIATVLKIRYEGR